MPLTPTSHRRFWRFAPFPTVSQTWMCGSSTRTAFRATRPTAAPASAPLAHLHMLAHLIALAGLSSAYGFQFLSIGDWGDTEAKKTAAEMGKWCAAAFCPLATVGCSSRPLHHAQTPLRTATDLHWSDRNCDATTATTHTLSTPWIARLPGRRNSCWPSVTTSTTTA